MDKPLRENDEDQIFHQREIPYLTDYHRRVQDGIAQVSAAAIATEPHYRWAGWDHWGNEVGQGRQEFNPFARQLCGSESRDRGNVQRQFEQSAEGRIRTVIDLRRVLLALGLLLTMIAVGLATAMTINQHGPSLVELSLLAIAVLLAAEQSQ
jgi:hypothetical protein